MGDRDAMARLELESLHRVGYGLYIVSSVQDGRVNGQIANALIQVCADPAAVAVCLNKHNLTHGYVASSRKFVASVLTEDAPLPFIGRFGFKSGRDVNKLEGVQTVVGVTGIPIVTIEYDGTGGFKNGDIIPYLKFSRKDPAGGVHISSVA